MVEVWAKVYEVEVEVEVEWMDEVSVGYPDVPNVVHFMVYSEYFLHHRLKRIPREDYIQSLILHSFLRDFYFT